MAHASIVGYERSLQGSIGTDINAYWLTFKSSGCAAARQRLIEHYMPFAKMLAAKQYANRLLRESEFNDYNQGALEGLISAIDRFDPSCDVRFEYFASKRIVGAILNSLELASERSAQLAARARIRRERLQSVKGETLDFADTQSLFDKLAEVSIGIALGIMLEGTAMLQSEGEADIATDDSPYQSVSVKQLRATLESAVDSLPERERMVIKYHYYFGIRFDEIALMLSVTKGRVSQLHKQALMRLRRSNEHAAALSLSL